MPSELKYVAFLQPFTNGDDGQGFLSEQGGICHVRVRDLTFQNLIPKSAKRFDNYADAKAAIMSKAGDLDWGVMLVPSNGDAIESGLI
ncbi:MAG: hypothetical protein AAGF24_12180 [Cyanobacteria bacterium P01_H01_bin.121]